MRINDVILKEQQLSEIDLATDLKQARQQQVQANKVNALAQTALTQWGKKVIALTNAAGGQPVDPTDYTNHLTDFVQKVMLGGTRVEDLDPSSQPKVAAAIKGVVDTRGDRTKLPQAFNALVTQASVARPDPAKVRGGGAATAGGFVTTPVQNLQVAPATQQNPTMVKYKNDIYRLTDATNMIWMDKNDRRVSDTVSALLSMAAKSI